MKKLLVSYKNHITIFLLGTSALLCLYSTQPVLENISYWAKVSVATTALTISATTLGVAIVAPLSGLISDYFGRKKVIVTALAVLFLTTTLAIFSRNFTALLLFRFLQGLSIPFIFSSAITYIAEQWDSHEATKFNSIYIAGTAFGGFSGRFFSGLAADLYGGWQCTFIVLSIWLFLILIVIMKLLPEEKHVVRINSYKTSLEGLLIHIKDKKVLITCFIAFSLLFQQVASFTFGSLLLSKAPFELNSIQIGSIFIIFLIPSIITPIAGMMINRYGYTMMFVLSCTLGISGLSLTLLPYTFCVIGGLTLSCISVFLGQSCGTGFIAKHCQQFRSAAVGLYLSSYYLGGSAGGIIPTKIYEFSGWNACVYLLIFVILMSCILSYIGWAKEDIKHV